MCAGVLHLVPGVQERAILPSTRDGAPSPAQARSAAAVAAAAPGHVGTTYAALPPHASGSGGASGFLNTAPIASGAAADTGAPELLKPSRLPMTPSRETQAGTLRHAPSPAGATVAWAANADVTATQSPALLAAGSDPTGLANATFYIAPGSLRGGSDVTANPISSTAPPRSTLSPAVANAPSVDLADARDGGATGGAGAIPQSQPAPPGLLELASLTAR